MKNVESTSRRLGRFAIAFTVVSLLLVAAVLGQPKLGDTVYNKTAGKKTEPARPAVTPTPTTTRKPQNNGKRPPRNTPPAKPAPPKNALEVTFLAAEPQVEILLDEQSVGFTDENLQFSRQMPPGEYTLTARNKSRVLVLAKKISVSPEQTIFTIVEEVKPVAVEPQPTPAPPKIDEKTLVVAAVELSEQVKKIIEMYDNPETTDDVTPEDWQVVFKAAQLGELQGYTAVQIEAQRWFASGQIELSKGQYVNATTAFNKALEFMPQSPWPLLGLGNAYFADKRYADALKLYTRALQADPKYALGHKKLGDTYRLLNKNKEAIAAYRSAVQFGYKTIETRYWLGTLMLDTKQIEEALAELEGVARDKPSAEIYLSIGSGYEKLKRDVSAIEAYLEAIKADPESALAHYRLAEVYFNLRELRKAKEAYEKALSLDPDGKVIKRNDVQKKLREVTEKSNR